ncbi:MAG: tRNA (adenosine(37)-N6)-dimethylallyltransferase MiaA [Treponema sp.]|nr:tRNA (adenosine(37)-N6)-dimethylallyltransferase MiaA [Treponema sp.]
MQKIPVLVIFAPTASGKTALVEKLFSVNSNSVLAGKAEIINADSMQVYKGMDIGTAKPDKDFLKLLPHHCIDVCEPNEHFGVGEFLPMADNSCAEVFLRGKLPVVCGGTAFYIRNFMYGLPKTPKADLDFRSKLQKRLKTEGAKKLMEELEKLDYESAKRIHINDEYRILRALEVCYASGKSLSYFTLEENLRPEYDFFTIELVRAREKLYERINLRVLQMIDKGLEAEFKGLIKKGFSKNDPGMQAIGYREFFMAEEEGKPFDMQRITELIQRDTRHYAKRQITFFSTMKNIHRYDAENFAQIESAIISRFCSL